MSKPATPSPSLTRKAGGFLGLSGMGWLVDFVLLLLLVRFAQFPVFMANLISASTAALTVFFLSRRMVFRTTHGSAFGRALIYLGYTLFVIVLFSGLMRWLTARLLASGIALLATRTYAAAVAKIVVTPLNFALNFTTARMVNEFGATDTSSSET